MIKAGVIGSTGYAGQELVRLLSGHPEVELKYVSTRTYKGQLYSNVFPNFKSLLGKKCVNMNVGEMTELCDVIFLALPHGLTFNQVTNEVLEKAVVIDLGADFRLKDPTVYQNWYGIEHTNTEILEKAVYGLCELNREHVKTSRLIANPGCYTTCSILSLTPALRGGFIDPHSILIDAKSGVSGAGRSLSMGVHFAECNESVKAYKIASHRHTPEIEQELSLAAGEKILLNFTPHLVPMNRGILATSYGNLVKEVTVEEIYKYYLNFYEGENFIRVLKPGNLPETRFVRYSNYTDIGLTVDKRTNRLIITGTIDNLVKGAAGQAVQNLNIIFGLPETTGLESIPALP